MFLVVGCNGQLGTELKALLGAQAEYVDREDLDITDEAAVKAFFDKQAYEFVINCAAYTAVDLAEDNAETARKVNEDGVRNLARYGKRIIHISTDYVFDGTGHKPYEPEDKTNPVSVYGLTKRSGEQAALQEADTAVVIRTAWLYSPYGNNFVKTMRRLGAERESLNVVYDQIGTPTYAADLAQTIVEMMPQIKSGTKEIYHLTDEGVCSWYDFACEIMSLSELKCRVCPIPSSAYPTKAKRPFYSVLSKEKIKRDFKITIPYWKESLVKCLKLF